MILIIFALGNHVWARVPAFKTGVAAPAAYSSRGAARGDDAANIALLGYGGTSNKGQNLLATRSDSSIDNESLDNHLPITADYGSRAAADPGQRKSRGFAIGWKQARRECRRPETESSGDRPRHHLMRSTRGIGEGRRGRGVTLRNPHFFRYTWKEWKFNTTGGTPFSRARSRHVKERIITRGRGTGRPKESSDFARSSTATRPGGAARQDRSRRAWLVGARPVDDGRADGSHED